VQHNLDEQRHLAKVTSARPKLRERVYVDGEGHDLVVDDVRCDREWENANAEKVREDWESARGAAEGRVRPSAGR
jgi:hypothetical protein